MIIGPLVRSIPPRVRGASALACLLLAPVAAAAADRPPVMPRVDAIVTYHVQPQGMGAETVRVYFGGGGAKLRIDGPQGQGSTIVDRPAGQVTIVMNAQRAYMVVPSKTPIEDPFLLGADMQYARAGTTEIIAGQRCDDWRITSPKGASVACVTADGVLLSASGPDASGGSGHIVASAVTLGPIPAADFAPPPGFERIAHPATSTP